MSTKIDEPIMEQIEEKLRQLSGVRLALVLDFVSYLADKESGIRSDSSWSSLVEPALAVEFEAWEAVSDEALFNFESSLSSR